MPKRTNPWLPICPRDPSRRLHPLQELSNVPVETFPTPASSLESGTSFVGEALNFEGSILKDHLTEEADSQGESVKTARDSDSDSETEVVLRAASPVVPVGGLQFIVPSRHILQPQRQAMAAVKKFISPPIFRGSPDEYARQWINSSSHLELNIDLQHHIQKGYSYAIDNDVNIHRQLEHKLNCLGYCTWTLLQETGSYEQESRTTGKIRRKTCCRRISATPAVTGLRSMFQTEFQPDNYDLFQETRLRSRTQGIDVPAVRYYYEILNLCRLVDSNMSEAHRL
ncbi:hypothetical protein OUZ56_032921 [Daphnia magna]|uniref:Uncharacterized protein n=1 Tax=Daphnia magna TaxID=35525 RepID=A0ABQ9ZX75_9CRUS|nr:hypothetical protein OUZ56_032921 [Daphnia magna]